MSGAADGHATPWVWVWVCPPLRPTGPFPKSADNSLHKVFRRWTSISEDNDLGRAPGPPLPPLCLRHGGGATRGSRRRPSVLGRPDRHRAKV